MHQLLDYFSEQIIGIMALLDSAGTTSLLNYFVRFYKTRDNKDKMLLYIYNYRIVQLKIIEDSVSFKS